MPEAHKIMTTHGIRRLPLVDRHGHLVGIITLGDVRGAEPSQATSLSIWEMNYLMPKLKAMEIMTSNPITVFETATIGAAARIMLDSRISGLPLWIELVLWSALSPNLTFLAWWFWKNGECQKPKEQK
jgi:CBS domain-containing protein